MKKITFILLSLLISVAVYAQRAEFLGVGTESQTTQPATYDSNNGPSISAELKMATTLDLPGDYYRTINLALSPWYDPGWGHSYNINVNWNGIYYRRSNNPNFNQWDGWRKVIMTEWWDNSVEIPGNLNVKGDIKVGSVSSPKQLDVYGLISAREVRVETKGADFVFDAGYKLKSLDEVKSHIEEHKHLPGIPSAAEMQENGIGISELSTLLLQKVEELTLYTLEQKERIEKLEKQNEELVKLLNVK